MGQGRSETKQTPPLEEHKIDIVERAGTPESDEDFQIKENSQAHSPVQPSDVIAALRTGSSSSITRGEVEKLLLEVEDASSSESTESSESESSCARKCNACCSFARLTVQIVKLHPYSTSSAIIGLSLLFGGTYVYYSNGKVLVFAAAILFCLGLIFILPSISKIMMFLLVQVLDHPRIGYLIGSTNVANFEYYLLGAYKSIYFALWLGLSTIALGILRNVEDSEGTYKSIIDSLYKIILLALIWALCMVAARSICLYITRSFGRRTYKERIVNSLIHEKLVNILSGQSSTATLNRALQSSALGGELYLQPDSLYFVEQYIIDHHIDGNLVASRSTRDIYLDLAYMTAKKMFVYVYSKTYKEDPLKNIGIHLRESQNGNEARNENLKSGISDNLRDSARNKKMKKSSLQSGSSAYGNRIIQKQKFVEQFDPLEENQRERTWEMVAGPDIEILTYKDLKSILEALFLERRNLANSMKSSKKVVDSLNNILLCSFLVLEIIAAVVIFSSIENFGTVFGIIIAPITALSFIFGPSLANTFNSLVFLFAVKPYDIGDWIQLGPDEELYEVVKLDLLTTELLRWDGVTAKMENIRVSQLPLNNLSLSSNKFGKVLKIMVDARYINADVVLKLEKTLREYIKRQPTKFNDQLAITIRDFEPPYQCWIYLFIEHPYSVQQIGRWRKDQSDLLVLTMDTLKANGVEFHSLSMDQMMRNV